MRGEWYLPPPPATLAPGALEPPPSVCPLPVNAWNLGSSFFRTGPPPPEEPPPSYPYALPLGSGGGLAGSTQLLAGAPVLRGAGGGQVSPLTMKTVQLSYLEEEGGTQ